MVSEDLTLLSDDANYRDTLQTYLKYMQQLPPQRLWMKEELGPRIAQVPHRILLLAFLYQV